MSFVFKKRRSPLKIPRLFPQARDTIRFGYREVTVSHRSPRAVKEAQQTVARL